MMTKYKIHRKYQAQVDVADAHLWATRDAADAQYRKTMWAKDVMAVSEDEWDLIQAEAAAMKQAAWTAADLEYQAALQWIRVEWDYELAKLIEDKSEA
jgi:hypothetical protein